MLGALKDLTTELDLEGFIFHAFLVHFFFFLFFVFFFLYCIYPEPEAMNPGGQHFLYLWGRSRLSEIRSLVQISIIIITEIMLWGSAKHTFIHAKWFQSISGGLQPVYWLLIDCTGREMGHFLRERSITCWQWGNKVILWLLVEISR